MPASSFYIGDLMYKILTGKTGEISRVRYAPQKERFPEETEGEEAPAYASCTSTGVPVSFLEEMVQDLRALPDANMHRLMVARKGKVILDARFAPFACDLWHVTYSLCKTITGMAAGFLISEGRLSMNDRLGDFFEPTRTGFSILRGSQRTQTAEITVEQLLTMTSGAVFNESGAVSGNDWTVRFMDAGVHFTPGTQFEYNSMNSYMLSALITKITGMTLTEYLTPRLFAPLKITRVFWEQSPEGYDKGGWGMFLRMEDAVKLGILFLNEGRYNGKQVLPEGWVKEAVTPRVATAKSGAPQYGYHLWCTDTRPGAYTFNGMFGQDVFVYPDLDMVVATQAGNNDVFQSNAMVALIRGRISSAEEYGVTDRALPADPGGEGRLSHLLRTIAGCDTQPFMVPAGAFSHRAPVMHTGSTKKRTVRLHHQRRSAAEKKDAALSGIFDGLDGVSYRPDALSFGLMPLMMQVVHNNFTDGITKVSFVKDARGLLRIAFTEGESLYEIPCNLRGMGGIVHLDFHGEDYAVCAQTSVSTNEDDAQVLTIRLFFLEEASVRIIRFLIPASQRYAYAPAEMLMTMDETPGSDILIHTIKRMTTDAPSPGVIVSTLESTGVTSAISGRVRGMVLPTIRLTMM